MLSKLIYKWSICFGLVSALASAPVLAEETENEAGAGGDVWLTPPPPKQTLQEEPSPLKQTLQEESSPLKQALQEEPAYVFDWEISSFLEEGIAYHREGELAGAIALYERCRQHDARRIEVLPYLALALDQQGRHEDSLRCYEEYLLQEPDDDLVRFNSAVALAHAGDFVRAAEVAEPMLERYQREPLYTLLGVAHLHLGHKELALQYLKKAVELQPEKGGVYSNLGSAQLQWGDVAEASRNLSRALQLAPDDGAVLNNAGAVLEAKGKRQLAVLAFQEAAKRGITSAEINELALDCALGQADTLQAAQCADKYPQLSQARLLYVWALLADERPQEAAEELERWQSEHGEDMASCVYLGNIYYKMGHYAKALGQYRAVLSVQDTPEAHYNISLCLSKLGQAEEAGQEARRAYEMSAQRPEIIYNLARCCEALENYGEAQKLYRRLAAEYPNFIDPQQLEKHCRRF